MSEQQHTPGRLKARHNAWAAEITQLEQQRDELLAFAEAFNHAPFGKEESETDAEWHNRLCDTLAQLTDRARTAIAKCKQ